MVLRLTYDFSLNRTQRALIPDLSNHTFTLIVSFLASPPAALFSLHQSSSLLLTVSWIIPSSLMVYHCKSIVFLPSFAI